MVEAASGGEEPGEGELWNPVGAALVLSPLQVSICRAFCLKEGLCRWGGKKKV